MSEVLSHENFNLESPIIIGAAGDIGRTLVQQLLDRQVEPAGIVLTEGRLESPASRRETADQLARNYDVDGQQAIVLENVDLSRNTLNVDGAQIPVFTPQSQHEAFQQGRSVIDATGQHRKRSLLEPFLEEGAKFVTVTSPIKLEEEIPTVIHGVSSDEATLSSVAAERLMSTSSCTTTAVSSLLNPLLNGAQKIEFDGALVNVAHARTNSNGRDIRNNIMLAASGAKREIPRVLGFKPEDIAFNLECARADAACGSLASVTLLFGPDHEVYDEDAIRANIVRALDSSESSFEIDNEVVDTKGAVGRLSSAVVNLGKMRLQRVPGHGGSVATDINIFYDNVAGYTRSVIDGYAMASDAIDR